MKEAIGDLWTVPADVRVITINGDVNANGEAVMGRGSALEAATRFPGLARELGTQLRDHGLRVHWLGRTADEAPDHWEWLWTLPTKHSWRDHRADLALIERGAHQLMRYAVGTARFYGTMLGWAADRPRVVLPRPGCGPRTGRLDWNDVHGVLCDILDDRFTVVTFPPAPPVPPVPPVPPRARRP